MKTKEIMKDGKGTRIFLLLVIAIFFVGGVAFGCGDSICRGCGCESACSCVSGSGDCGMLPATCTCCTNCDDWEILANVGALDCGVCICTDTCCDNECGSGLESGCGSAPTDACVISTHSGSADYDCRCYVNDKDSYGSSTCCDGTLYNLDTNVNHCGSCDNDCTDDNYNDCMNGGCCNTSGSACSSNNDCCSNYCDSSNTCSDCVPKGSSCASGVPCCGTAKCNNYMSTCADCKGDLRLSLNETNTNQGSSVRINETGLTSCDNPNDITITDGSGSQVCTISPGGSYKISAPSMGGDYDYTACVDLEGDGDCSEGAESDTVVLHVSYCTLNTNDLEMPTIVCESGGGIDLKLNTSDSDCGNGDTATIGVEGVGEFTATISEFGNSGYYGFRKHLSDSEIPQDPGGDINVTIESSTVEKGLDVHPIFKLRNLSKYYYCEDGSTRYDTDCEDYHGMGICCGDSQHFNLSVDSTVSPQNDAEFNITLYMRDITDPLDIPDKNWTKELNISDLSTGWDRVWGFTDTVDQTCNYTVIADLNSFSQQCDFSNRTQAKLPCVRSEETKRWEEVKVVSIPLHFLFGVKYSGGSSDYHEELRVSCPNKWAISTGSGCEGCGNSGGQCCPRSEDKCKSGSCSGDTCP